MRRVSGTILLTASIAASSVIARAPETHIFERDTTCPLSTDVQCSAGLSGFCCPQNTACIALAANTTVLCCPGGQTCDTILPITCDITKQNGAEFPGATLQTSALNSTLTTCGSACCPFGYSCNTSGQCIMNANQQNAPPVPTSSASAASTQSSISSSTTASATIVPITSPSSASPIEQASCDKFPPTAVVVGFFPGMLLGVSATIVSICLLGARRERLRRHSNSSFGNISEPQLHGSDLRSDFLRKTSVASPSSKASSTPLRRKTVSRVRSIFRRPLAPGETDANAEVDIRSPRPAPEPPVPRPQMMMVQEVDGRPVTPANQRDPSYEDINIFTDGNTASALRERARLGERDVRASSLTTFTVLMERSGLGSLRR